MAIRLDDYQEINGVSLLGHAIAYWSGYPVWLIARHSLRHSAHANTVVVYTDTQKKVRVMWYDALSFCDSQSSEVARPKMPTSKGR